MNEEEISHYIRRLKEEQENLDTEMAHWHADKILCEILKELGHHDIVAEYEKVDKWYA